MSKLLIDGFLLQTSVIDDFLCELSHKELKIILLYCRYGNEIPPNDVLVKHHLTTQDFVDFFSKYDEPIDQGVSL